MILNAAGKSNFVKIVGRNPNIEINKAGEIILKGVQKNGFAGKVYNTGLSAEDFF